MLSDLKAKNDGGTTGGVHQHQMCAKISARILASRCEIATSEAVQKNAHLAGLGACCKKCVVPRNDRRRSSRETRPMYEEKRFRARARQPHLYVPGKVSGALPDSGRGEGALPWPCAACTFFNSAPAAVRIG